MRLARIISRLQIYLSNSGYKARIEQFSGLLAEIERDGLQQGKGVAVETPQQILVDPVLSQSDQSNSAHSAGPQNPTMPPPNNEQGDSSELGDLLVPLGVLALAIWGTVSAIRRIRSLTRRIKGRRAIKSAYTSSAVIGNFQQEGFYVDQHLAATGRTNKDTSVAVLNLLAPIVKLTSESKAKWFAEVGEVDQAAYANAMGAYQIALTKYETEKANFEATEERNRLNSSNQHYVSPSWNASPPEKPKKKNFLVYRSASDISYSRIEHPWKFGCGAEQLRIGNVGPISSPLTENALKSLLKIYEQIFPMFFEAAPKLDNLPGATRLIYDEKTVIDGLWEEIENQLRSKAKQETGEHCRNLRVDVAGTNISDRKLLSIPLVVVASTLNGKAIKVTIHDHLLPEVLVT